MSNILISIIIPVRNEFPNVVSTCHSIWNCLEADGIDPNASEIILVANLCDDDYWNYPKVGEKGTTTHLMARGAYYAGRLRILYDPIAGNHSARNKGARVAKGKYVFFSDGHMQYRPGAFKYAMKAVDESGGLVHMVIAWQGAYPPHPSSLGYQYTIKLGEEIKGTWANYCVSQNDWFYIAAQGHCSVMANRKQFLEFGGYPDIHRTYGGGEFYTDLKWWMLGSSVVVEPRAIGYHLASGRGYSYNHDDYIHNVLNIAYALGMDDWRERAYINWLRRGRKDVLDRIMAEGEKEMDYDRRWIAKRRKYAFNDLLKIQVEYGGKKWVGPWNKMNLEKFGVANGGLQIIHDTWFNLVKGTQAERAYIESKHQEELERFINKYLSPFIYKRDQNNIVYAKDILAYNEINAVQSDSIITPIN